MKRLIPVVLVLLTSCASEPIVDMKGVNKNQYEQDLTECRDYATQVNTGKEVAKRGAVGAVVGGAIGAAIGNHEVAERIAGVGAVSGAARGAGSAEQRKERVMFNCLRGRGYRVLG